MRRGEEVHAWTSEISYVGKVALKFPSRHSGRATEPGMLGVRDIGICDAAHLHSPIEPPLFRLLE